MFNSVCLLLLQCPLMGLVHPPSVSSLLAQLSTVDVFWHFYEDYLQRPAQDTCIQIMQDYALDVSVML